MANHGHIEKATNNLHSEIRVYICYATKDYETARKLYHDLEDAGVKPWDREKILPGQTLNFEIFKAIKESTYFLILLSSHSITEKGFVQTEMKKALEIFNKCPQYEIFIIPARIEECEPIDEVLLTLKCADLFPSYEEGLKNILRSIEYGCSIREKDNLSVLLEKLSKHINENIKKLPDDKAEEIKQALEILSKTVTRGNPKKEWYELTSKYLSEASELLDEKEMGGTVSESQIPKITFIPMTFTDDKRDISFLKLEKYNAVLEQIRDGIYSKFDWKFIAFYQLRGKTDIQQSEPEDHFDNIDVSLSIPAGTEAVLIAFGPPDEIEALKDSSAENTFSHRICWIIYGPENEKDEHHE